MERQQKSLIHVIASSCAHKGQHRCPSWATPVQVNNTAEERGMVVSLNEVKENGEGCQDCIVTDMLTRRYCNNMVIVWQSAELPYPQHPLKQHFTEEIWRYDNFFGKHFICYFIVCHVLFAIIGIYARLPSYAFLTDVSKKKNNHDQQRFIYIQYLCNG